ncbi:DEAD/DEAH box helicase [Sporosarcina trichiuri]|uniref:DEAD/DEAH box helicase n=1 Tax=Sporosarcina trichiuri TaxID=3056445 RepID=UPI0025B44E38|nr:DEAD/DEAH box helicase family protein [Sporosarcina sp. 0.2-SM1T-5]WJY26135.1 DEAD/DEAH box helicase family protein [Sporosarcina sp. 0.2-SM1T-5]
MNKAFDPAVRGFLDGRVWLRLHTLFPREQIDAHIDQGFITVQPGVTMSKNRIGQSTFKCNRCENENLDLFTQFDCLACGGPCAYCRNCLQMGRVSCCTELIRWSGPPSVYPTGHALAWAGTLTPHQQKASEELHESTELKRPHLIHAVCGSGKTEILFEPIHRALSKGHRVCLAAPRVDVILELEPRLKAAFPDTIIEALYGGADVKRFDAQLILATTHQLYRFDSAFDVIFVDEADAFPYTAEATLQYAVRKAAKHGAPIHFVTATPSDRLLAQVRKAGAVSTIHRRYHGHPLPGPRYAPLWNYAKQLKKGRVPKVLHQWIKDRLDREEPFLVFFHEIDLMTKAEPLIQTLDSRIRAVHSAHPDRKEHVQDLRAGKIPGLLTTTILERGITIKNVQVAVVGSEQGIFDRGALVQIGGRVGRNADYPTGDFVLFHDGISYAMDAAKREIERLNRGGTT